MRITRSLEFLAGSKEEKLPYADPDFPYLASRTELDYFREHSVPWHWHSALELFYMESGALTYHTPGGTAVFPAGSAGMVNANVLHMTESQPRQEKNVQLLHIFEPALLAGNHGSTIERRYIAPVTASARIEMLALDPGTPEHRPLIQMIRSAFLLPEKEWGYELRLRDALSQIWLALFRLCRPLLESGPGPSRPAADKVKTMMAYIHEHYAEKLSITQLDGSAFLSERECYRAFQRHLHMTPAAYLKSYRMQAARRLLADTRMPVTEVGYACGLGSPSYFGRLFREDTGYTPLQYRRKWQDHDKK